MPEFHAVIQRSDVFPGRIRVLETYETIEEANAHYKGILDEIDAHRASVERHRHACRLLGESWIKASGLLDLEFGVAELAEDGEEISYWCYVIAACGEAADPSRNVCVDKMKSDINELRERYHVSTPVPDWPPDPISPFHLGWRSDHNIATFKTP